MENLFGDYNDSILVEIAKGTCSPEMRAAFINSLNDYSSRFQLCQLIGSQRNAGTTEPMSNLEEIVRFGLSLNRAFVDNSQDGAIRTRMMDNHRKLLLDISDWSKVVLVKMYSDSISFTAHLLGQLGRDNQSIRIVKQAIDTLIKQQA